ncbi:MAG: hypothetical protein JXD22_06100 [Sedimentisphaerales bacterium]|nr:hypothetical protein [Sedimentisphaerales bacterium]
MKFPKNNLTIAFLVILQVSLLSAQQQDYSNESKFLCCLARNYWSPVELQYLGYLPPSADSEADMHNIRKATLLLQAAVELDPANEMAWRDLNILLTSDVVNDPGRAAEALFQYSQLVNDDLQPVLNWVSYRLNNLQDRESREYFLQQTIPSLNAYPFALSQALTQLAIMQYEKGDTDNAHALLLRAYNVSRFNVDALARKFTLPEPDFTKNTENLSSEKIDQIIQNYYYDTHISLVLRWRQRIQNQPYDLDATLELIEVLKEMGLHELAQKYYPHAYNLIGLAGSGQSDLKNQLRFRQIVSAYSANLYADSITLAQQLLRDNPDDLLAAGLMGLAMKKLDLNTDAQNTLKTAGDRAVQKLQQTGNPDPTALNELAWFFCFIDPDPVRALQFAQRAYDAFESSQDKRLAAPNLAYAWIMNDKPDDAENYLKNFDPNDPVVSLTQSKILIARQDPDAAVALLQKIDLAAAGILAENISDTLNKLREPSIPQTAADPDDSTPSSAEQPDLLKTLITNNLAGRYNDNDLLIVSAPEKFISCSMRLPSDIVRPGDPMIAKLYLSNISDLNKTKTPVALGPENLIDPHVLITAEITPKPQSLIQPIILVHRYMLQSAALAPGKSSASSEILNVGQLRQVLENHPQRDYQITFQIYLDPVADSQGSFACKIPALQPAPVTVSRKAFVPTPDRMNSYLRDAKMGSANKRINALKLFASLLMEDRLARRGQLNYQPYPVDTVAIRSALASNLSNPEPRVRAVAAWSFQTFQYKLTTREIRQLAEMINDDHWFCRFMVLDTLEPITDLNEYFDWAETFEENPLIKRQIKLLQNQPWQVIDLPLDVPQEAPQDSLDSQAPQDTQDSPIEPTAPLP